MIIKFRRFWAILALLIICAGGVSRGELFPSVLMNKGEKTDNELIPDKSLARNPISIKIDNRIAEGYLIFPDKKDDKRLPAILFLHTEDEKPDAQLKRMEILARYGYAVLCIDWQNTRGAEEAYKFLQNHSRIDDTCISILGAHQGATEAILLGCTQRRTVKAVIAVAGMPPYDMEGGDPAGAIWAPVLLVHGEVDTQLPVSVSRYFYYNLKEKNRIAETLILPHSRHYFNDIEWEQVLENVHKFITKYVLTVPDDKKYKPEDYRREKPR